MKIKNYESMIDGMIEAFIIFLWYLFFLIVTAFCLTLIMVVLNVSFFHFETFFPVFFYGILPFSALVTIPITIVLYYTRKAKKIYKNYGEKIRLRDFWMGFATTVRLNSRRSNTDGMNNWLEENLSYMHKSLDNDSDFIFAAKSDAMAFKLAWYE